MLQVPVTIGCLVLLVSCAGCTSTSQIPSRAIGHISDFVQNADQKLLARMAARDVEQEALKAELKADREAELACRLAEINAERDDIRRSQEYRAAALRADTDRRREAQKQDFDESVRTSLGLQLEQRVKLGQLQVNMEQLAAVLDSREKDFEYRKRIYEEAQREAEMYSRMSALRSMAAQKSGSGIAAQMAQANCASPPGMAAQRAPTPQPVRQPLLPTEIPFMVPISLEIGMVDAGLDNSEIRRLPIKQPCRSGAPLRNGGCQAGCCQETANNVNVEASPESAFDIQTVSAEFFQKFSAKTEDCPPADDKE
ncbi:MAG: hypothetical protein HQ518_04120 [Rhodopirellula sp.]|nr:hypothetical protein [Rhodopirellula sp.]